MTYFYVLLPLLTFALGYVRGMLFVNNEIASRMAVIRKKIIL